MERITKIAIPMAIVVSILVLYLFIDIGNQATRLEEERDELRKELGVIEERVVELEVSLANCTSAAQTYYHDARDFYDKWQAERTIAYAIWQMFDSATNITWEGQDFTQVNILIPKYQWEYLRNLSEIYGTEYED